jgi:tetratricopeptide (TPR) repeat protein
MKIQRLGWTAIVLLAFGVVSCTANLEVKKKQGEAFRNLGEAYYRQGNYTLALKEFLKSEALYPNDPFLQNDLGLTYMAKQKPDLAITYFKKALKINPEYVPAKNNLGTAYLSKKEWDTAIGYFKEVTGNLLYATPHFPLSNLGLAYYNKKEYTLAEKYYLEALEVEPKFVNAMLGLGRTYIAVGKSSEAVATLEIAVKIYPEFGQAYFDLGKAYTLSHDYKKALDAYERVVELAPDSPLAREAGIEAQKMKTILK